MTKTSEPLKTPVSGTNPYRTCCVCLDCTCTCHEKIKEVEKIVYKDNIVEKVVYKYRAATFKRFLEIFPPFRWAWFWILNFIQAAIFASIWGQCYTMTQKLVLSLSACALWITLNSIVFITDNRKLDNWIERQ